MPLTIAGLASAHLPRLRLGGVCPRNTTFMKLAIWMMYQVLCGNVAAAGGLGRGSQNPLRLADFVGRYVSAAPGVRDGAVVQMLSSAWPRSRRCGVPFTRHCHVG